MKYILLLLCALLLTACANTSQMQTADITHPSTTVISSEPIPFETTEQTEPSMEYTEPTVETPKLLNVESGTILNRFTGSSSGFYFDYYTFIPDNATLDMPLVIFLHGDGEIGRIDALQNIALMDNSKEYYGNEFPFIAIAPCRLQKSWSTGSSPDAIIALIEETIDKYHIDQNHVIISGFSSGAMGVWYLISHYPAYFSAAVPISCPNEYPIIYENAKNVPIWSFAGEKEEYYTRKLGEIINYTNEIGGNAKLTVVDDMPHAGMDKAAFTKELIEWMLTQ